MCLSKVCVMGYFCAFYNDVKCCSLQCLVFCYSSVQYAVVLCLLCSRYSVPSQGMCYIFFKSAEPSTVVLDTILFLSMFSRPGAAGLFYKEPCN